MHSFDDIFNADIGKYRCINIKQTEYNKPNFETAVGRICPWFGKLYTLFKVYISFV